MYGRPLGKRKRIQITIGLVILAWATQLLLHQWGYGAEVEPTPNVLADPPAGPARAPQAPPTASLAADRQVAAGPALAPSPAPGPSPAPAPREEVSPLRTLRQLLTEDLGVRLNVPVEQLQVNFNPKDERVLNLAEPQ